MDTLDFPLNPPDAEDTYGGGDFGRFRSRYGLYHAGEDWRLRNRAATLGTPVHSIGTGVVTWAEPWGWGDDKGVVIVRHAFADGSTILSFYGHLDPESVVLNAGDCLVRGDPVGRIGNPRTSPHLHWEVRTHTMTAPGRGYSAQDPTLSGWRSPSQFVWQQRLASSEGVLWTRPPATSGITAIGPLDPESYLVIHEDRLVAIDVRDGNTRWEHPSDEPTYAALIHPDGRIVYRSSALGSIEALAWPGAGAEEAPALGSPLTPIWQVDVDEIFFPTLLPLPQGGVLLLTQRKMTALSSSGIRLWEEDTTLWSVDWEWTGEQLLLAGAGGEIQSIGKRSTATWESGTGGNLARVGGQTLTYDEDGIHRLDLAARSSELIYALPGGFPGHTDLALLPDGVTLATHRDASGESLVALNADGSERWRRSYPATFREERHLLALDGHAYLVSQVYGLSGSEISVHEVDLENAELVHLFTGGSRVPDPKNTWLVPVGPGRLLIHIGGSGMLALDLQEARETVESQQQKSEQKQNNT